MDLKNKNKASNIIFSILIIIFLVLPFIGFIPFPANAFKTFSLYDVRADGVCMWRYYLIDEWKFVFDFLKNYKDYLDANRANTIANTLFVVIFLGTTLLCGVFYIINMIKGLVKTIQGFAMKVESSEITKYLIRVAAVLMVYASILNCLMFSEEVNPPHINSIMFGSQLLFIVICAVCLLVISAIIHVSSKDNKPMTSKVLETVIATSSFGLMFVYVMYAVRFTGSSGHLTLGLLRLIEVLIPQIVNNTDYKSYSIAIFIGMVVICVAFSFLAQFAQVAFGANTKDDKKKNDFAKSLIVKSALFLGINLIGSLLILIPLRLSDEGATSFSTIYVGLYLGIGMSLAFLALSIADKTILKNANPQPAYEVKEESSEVVTEPVVETKSNPQPEPEPVKKVEETPKAVETKVIPQPEVKQQTPEERADELARKIIDTLEKMNAEKKQ